MKARQAAKDLFSRFMAALSRQEIDLRKTIGEWENVREEMKRAGLKLDIPNFILLQAHKDLETVMEHKEGLQNRSMEFFQELAMSKISETEIEDDFVSRMLAEGTA